MYIKPIMKLIEINKEYEFIKCPKCHSVNIGKDGFKDDCEHIIFIGTSETDESILDKESLSKDYDFEKHETIVDYFKEKLDSNYTLFIDSSTRQIDLYLLYKNI